MCALKARAVWLRASNVNISATRERLRGIAQRALVSVVYRARSRKCVQIDAKLYGVRHAV